MNTEFDEILEAVRDEAMNNESWRGLFFAKVFLSVAKSSFRCELFQVSSLDAEAQRLVWSILTMKNCKGWDSDRIHSLACEIANGWKHKLPEAQYWRGSYANRSVA